MKRILLLFIVSSIVLKSKMTFIEYWHVNCIGCIKSFKHYQKLNLLDYDEFEFEFINSFDNHSQIEKFIKKYKFQDFAKYFKIDSSTIQGFEPLYYPYILILSENRDTLFKGSPEYITKEKLDYLIKNLEWIDDYDDEFLNIKIKRRKKDTAKVNMMKSDDLETTFQYINYSPETLLYFLLDNEKSNDYVFEKIDNSKSYDLEIFFSKNKKDAFEKSFDFLINYFDTKVKDSIYEKTIEYSNLSNTKPDLVLNFKPDLILDSLLVKDYLNYLNYNHYDRHHHIRLERNLENIYLYNLPVIDDSLKTEQIRKLFLDKIRLEKKLDTLKVVYNSEIKK